MIGLWQMYIGYLFIYAINLSFTQKKTRVNNFCEKILKENQTVINNR